MTESAPVDEQEGSSAVWFAVPDGYAELPLRDIPAVMERSEQLINELGTPSQREISGSVIGSLTYFLQELASADAVFCGIGRHLSRVDGRLLTSNLVVSLLSFPGRRNPRLVL